MENLQNCELLGLASDGSPIVRLQGREISVDLQGIEIIQPPSELYRQIFEVRLARIKKPLRCRVVGWGRRPKIKAQLFYFGWQDKSGDVWLDVAPILLEEGVARVASYNFPERKEYLKHERKAPR